MLLAVRHAQLQLDLHTYYMEDEACLLYIWLYLQLFHFLEGFITYLFHAQVGYKEDTAVGM